MTYNTIKWILRNQIKTQTRTLWTWKRGGTIKDELFTCIYKNYNDELPIYTPTQLLDIIVEEEKNNIQGNS